MSTLGTAGSASAAVQPVDTDEPATDDPSTSRPRRASRPLRHRLRWPFGAGAVIQLILVMGDRMPSVDAISYFETGRNWVAGNGYVRQGSPELHFPPVAPISLGVLERVLGSEMAALRTWNLAWGLAAVLLLTAVAWFLSRDDDVTVATAWFATLVPGVVTLFIKNGSGSELPAGCLVIGAALAVLWAFDGDAPRPALHRYGALVGGGALIGLAYLTRPEALLPGVAVGTFVLLLGWKAAERGIAARARSAVTAGAAFGFAALLFMAPYLSYMQSNTGSWSLTSKTKDASIDAWRAVAEDNRLERDQILYAIQPDGVSLGPETVPLTQLAREHPRGWLTIAWTNLTTMASLYFGEPLRNGPTWELIPIFLLIPAVERIWTTRRRPATQLFAGLAAIPMLTCFLFFTLPRYLIMATAILIPFGTWGLVVWLRKLSPKPQRIAMGVVAVLTLASFIGAVGVLLPGSPRAERTEQRTAGEWLKENTDEDARVMTRSFHVQGYSERPVVAWPYADWQSTVEFARRMGVSYLVADETTVQRRRPELYDLLMTGDDPPPGVVLAHEFTERDRLVRIYAFDPPPPPSDQPPLPLGYVSD